MIVLDAVTVAASASESNADGVNVSALNGAVVTMKVTGDTSGMTFNWYTKPEKDGNFDGSPYASFTLSPSDGQVTRPLPGIQCIFEVTCQASNIDDTNAGVASASIVPNYKR